VCGGSPVIVGGERFNTMGYGLQAPPGAVAGSLGRSVVQLCEPGQARRSLNLAQYDTSAASVVDSAGLPVADAVSALHLGRAVLDTDAARDFATVLAP